MGDLVEFPTVNDDQLIAAAALRIDDAEPKLLICADAGMRNKKVIPYKPLVDEALRMAKSPPPHVLIVSRGLDNDLKKTEGRDLDYNTLRKDHENADVPDRPRPVPRPRSSGATMTLATPAIGCQRPCQHCRIT